MKRDTQGIHGAYTETVLFTEIQGEGERPARESSRAMGISSMIMGHGGYWLGVRQCPCSRSPCYGYNSLHARRFACGLAYQRSGEVRETSGQFLR
jgi:hypothetical protein